ncbi:MAG: GGDEF domain-containing protein [Lachnospiraceae bacterium]|nr:GGDEF domain-containing protein [Lachnospiraceae bacterium]
MDGKDRDIISLLESREAMLRLFDEVFFEYDADRDVICFFNTGSSFLNEGEVLFSKLLARFSDQIDPEDRPALDEFASALRERKNAFTVVVPANLLYDEESFATTLIRGEIKRFQSGKKVTVGRIHLMRMSDSRNTQSLSYDPLTEVVGKKDISRLARHLIDELHAGNTTIAIVDIDYFKHVNDFYGHMFGDQVLKTVAGILKHEIAEGGTVGRIGGDEFFVIFHNISERNNLRDYLHRIRTAVAKAFPDKGPQGDKPISLSIGTATFPLHAPDYETLFMIADYCLYLAKEKGRNRFIMYNPEKHASFEEIRKMKEEGSGSMVVTGRDDLPPGDVLTQMWFMYLYGERPSAGALLRNFAERFHIPFIMAYRISPAKMLACAGKQEEEAQKIPDSLFELLKPEVYEFRSRNNGLLICNNVNTLPKEMIREKEKLLSLELISFILIPCTDPEGKDFVLSFLSFHKNLVWNESHFIYYRLFADLLSRYKIEEIS